MGLQTAIGVRRVPWAALFVLVAACGGGEQGPAEGDERGPCYGNGTCNAGLVCLSDLCVIAPDGGPAEDAGAPRDAGPDAPDAEIPDGAAPDVGPVDSGQTEADAGRPDAGPAPDANLPDGGRPDAGLPDAGFPDSGPADAGFPDSGVRPDAGPDTNCNPVDTTGCPGGTDLCHWDPRIDRRQCGPARGNLGLETACDEGLQNCAPGYACTQTGAQAAPECHRVCDVFAGGLSCQNLPGRHPYYNCSVINGSRQYGVCLGRGTYCDVLAPMCPSGEVCSLDGGNQTTCQPAGSAQRDQACSSVNNCAVGQGLCIDLGAGSACRVACDPNQPTTCGANSRCVQIVGRGFGVCLPVACQPFTNPCPAGFVCSAINGPVECRPAGTAAIGAPCAANNECAAGVCVDVGGGARCEAPCDANNACGGAGQICVTLTGIGFGICR